MSTNTKKKSKKLYVRMKCVGCDNTNYYPHKSKQLKHVKEKKLALKKFCKFCVKRVEHKEAKK